MMNVCTGDVSTPPPAVPPLSLSRTLTVAVPLESAAGVNDRTPVGEIAGWNPNRNSALLSLLTMNCTVWLASPAPALMLAAHGMYCVPSPATDTFPLPVKLGAWFTNPTVGVAAPVTAMVLLTTLLRLFGPVPLS